MCFPNLNAIIRKKSHRENAIKGYIIKPSKTSALIKNRRKFYEEKRNGFRSGGINDLYCFIARPEAPLFIQRRCAGILGTRL